MSDMDGWARLIALTAISAILVAVLFAVGGVLPGRVTPVVRVGLVAPFEGAQRTTAYGILSAVKVAIARHNEKTRHTGGPLVDLVALDDGGRPEDSRQQALEMTIDPAVLGVVGPWSAETAKSSLPVYQAARLVVLLPNLPGDSFVAPGTEAVLKIDPPEAELEELAQDLNLTSVVSLAGHSPNRQALLAYAAMNRLLTILEEIGSTSSLTRESVFEHLNLDNGASVSGAG